MGPELLRVSLTVYTLRPQLASSFQTDKGGRI